MVGITENGDPLVRVVAAFFLNAGTDDFDRGMAGHNSAVRSFAKPGSHAWKPSHGFHDAFPLDFQGFQ
jgi:hypothetical protein